jgi:hypothetical protein
MGHARRHRGRVTPAKFECIGQGRSAWCTKAELSDPADSENSKEAHHGTYVLMEIKESEQMGSQYYTLTYQPQRVDPDGKFRRVRVILRNPDLRAVTKAGYYAPDAHAPDKRII